MHAMLIARRLATVAIVAWLAAASATAQQPDPEAMEFSSGPIPGWSFTPAIAVGVTHDSNLTLTSTRTADGGTRSDSLFSVAPAGSLNFRGKQTGFSAAYRGFLQRYVEVDGLDVFSQRATVGFNHAATRRVSVYARNNFTDSPTTDEVEVNGVPFLRTGSRTNTLAAGADIRLRKFTTLSTRYDVTWVDFDRAEDIPNLTGGWMHGIGGDLTERLSERLTLGGEYSYRTASLNEGSRDIGFQNAGAILRYQFGPHTTGSAAAGVGVLHDHSTDDMRTGPYVRLSITQILEHATVGAGFERQYVPSFGFGGPSNSQELRGWVQMPFGRQRFYVQASGAWRHMIPFEGDVLEIDTVRLRSTLGYAVTRWGRAEALYTYSRQDTIITGGEADRHRIGVQFVIFQPLRIR
ncbi:MAG: hypothetical protein ACRD15_00995 [Vicinamibacterales bacterium]